MNATRQARRWAAGHVDLERLGAVAADLLGVGVEWRVRRAQPLAAAPRIDDGVAVLLAPSDDMRLARGALLEVDSALAAALVARAVKRTAPILVKHGAPITPSIAGGFAAVIGALSRRAHTGVAMTIAGVGPAAELEADLAAREPELVAITLTVLVGDDAFSARVVIPQATGLGVPPERWNRQALAALGPTPLAIPIVACSARVTAAQVALLSPGDALLPGSWPLARGPDGGLVGRVLLSAPSSPLGLAARLVDRGHLVLGAEVEPLCAAEATMLEGDGDTMVTAIGEVPVVVRVEVGEAVMAAREWAALGRGDVVTLGQRVGAPVVLRVGGVPLARGELVEIDGDVGVRILDRLNTGDGRAP